MGQLSCILEIQQFSQSVSLDLESFEDSLMSCDERETSLFHHSVGWENCASFDLFVPSHLLCNDDYDVKAVMFVFTGTRIAPKRTSRRKFNSHSSLLNWLWIKLDRACIASKLKRLSLCALMQCVAKNLKRRDGKRKKINQFYTRRMWNYRLKENWMKERNKNVVFGVLWILCSCAFDWKTASCKQHESSRTYFTSTLISKALELKSH